MVEFLRDGAARHRHRVAVNQVRVEQAREDDRDAADLVEVVHHAGAAGLEVRDFGRPLRNLIELLDGEVDTGLGREREQVEHGVGGAPDGDL